MLTATAITSRLNDTTTTAIAEHWNTAYPAMRAITTNRITTHRRHIHSQAWVIDPNHPHADALRTYTPTEAQTRRRLTNTEHLRRTLHQLDNGTHRACTRSTGSFSPRAAYTAVRALLGITSANDHDLGAIYRLAAVLADASDEQHRLLTG